MENSPQNNQMIWICFLQCFIQLRNLKKKKMIYFISSQFLNNQMENISPSPKGVASKQMADTGKIYKHECSHSITDQAVHLALLERERERCRPNLMNKLRHKGTITFIDKEEPTILSVQVTGYNLQGLKPMKYECFKHKSQTLPNITFTKKKHRDRCNDFGKNNDLRTCRSQCRRRGMTYTQSF